MLVWTRSFTCACTSWRESLPSPLCLQAFPLLPPCLPSAALAFPVLPLSSQCCPCLPSVALVSPVLLLAPPRFSLHLHSLSAGCYVLSASLDRNTVVVFHSMRTSLNSMRALA